MTWTTQLRSEGPGGLHYWSQGAGAPLVMIHGVGLRAEAWAALVPLLSPQFTVYAIDMPGHGATPLMGAHALADYTTRVVAFIKGLGAPVCVVGHSMGAMIALDVAMQHPQAARSVVALNAIFERTPAATQAVQARADALLHSGRTDPGPTLSRWFGATPTGPMQSAASACRDWLGTVDTEGYARAYHVFAHHDGPDRAALARMQTRALFLTGGQDPNSTPRMSHAMADIAPQGRALVLQDAAHMAPMTHPDPIAQAIIALDRS